MQSAGGPRRGRSAFPPPRYSHVTSRAAILPLPVSTSSSPVGLARSPHGPNGAPFVPRTLMKHCSRHQTADLSPGMRPPEILRRRRCLLHPGGQWATAGWVGRRNGVRYSLPLQFIEGQRLVRAGPECARVALHSCSIKAAFIARQASRQISQNTLNLRAAFREGQCFFPP